MSYIYVAASNSTNINELIIIFNIRTKENRNKNIRIKTTY